MSERFLLFYSDNCKFCTNILEELKKSKLLKYIRLFSVDQNRSQVPQCITNVPTLYISKNEKFVGPDIYEWIHNVNNVYAPTESPRTSLTDTHNVPKEISSLNENSSFSSGYTFLTEEKESQEFLEHKFTFIDGDYEPIQTIEDSKNNKRCTAKDYDAYLKRRASDIKRIQK